MHIFLEDEELINIEITIILDIIRTVVKVSRTL